MRNAVLGCLLGTATLLLMNGQTTLIEAKPFLLPPNFFLLTTKTPSTQNSDCNCNTGSSTSNSFQIPDLITPKLRLLSTLIQTFSRFKTASTSNGGGTGSIGFTFNKFGGFAPATTAKTTTTSKPDHTTEPDSVFEPDKSEASSSSTTTTWRSTSVESSSSTTEYNYEADEGTQDTEKPGSIGGSEDKGTGYNYEGDTTGGYNYEANENAGYEKPTTASPSDGSQGYTYVSNQSTASNGGYQYSQTAENELLK